MEEILHPWWDDMDEENRTYTIVLYLFYLYKMHEADRIWETFTNDLIYTNRFHSQNDIMAALQEKTSLATYIMPQNTVLYRARIYERNMFDIFVKEHFPEVYKMTEDSTEMQFENEDIMSILFAIQGEEQWKELYTKWKRKKFKGYNNKESGAPPQKIASPGRANPEYIAYLYLCEDAVTPIYEVRPTIGQKVSVAKCKTRKELRLYDLTLHFPDTFEKGFPTVPSVFDTIGAHFSKPYTGQQYQYLPSQYISEWIKNEGFDGLRFESSLHHGGKNIVLFSPDSCDIISSEVKRVDEIHLDIRDDDLFDVYKNDLNDTEKK